MGTRDSTREGIILVEVEPYDGMGVRLGVVVLVKDANEDGENALHLCES
jgi:hypothetical protein